MYTKENNSANNKLIKNYYMTYIICKFLVLIDHKFNLLMHLLLYICCFDAVGSYLGESCRFVLQYSL